MSDYALNQWGQKLAVDDIVAYVAKTGSHTGRKLGIVTGLAQVQVRSYPSLYQPAVRVHWIWDGSYCDGDGPYSGLRRSTDNDSTIRVNNVLKIDPAGLADEVEAAFT